MMRLTKFAEVSGMSRQHLYKLFREGKLNAQQMFGKHTTIFVDEENPFEVNKSKEIKPKEKYLEDLRINLEKSGPVENLETLIRINKLVIQKELEGENPDMVKVSRCTKQLMDASKLLLQHQIDDADEGVI